MRSLRPIVVPSAAIACLIAAALLSGCGSAQDTLAVPESIKARRSEKVAMVVPAKGVQIYECKAKQSHAGAYEWAFVAPQADLLNARGEVIGKHYAGPTWESRDGSKIKGTLKARADAPQADAIPWLLMTAATEGPGGAFSGITSVQRVNTVGGTAPTAACGSANLGTTSQVPYTADYYLLSER